MVEAETVRRLLETVEQRLIRLQELSQIPLEQYVHDYTLQDRTERNFEIAIQACIDLGLYVLADLPSPLPNTNREVFAALGRQGVIRQELVPQLGRMAGFRNVLAHGYASLLPEQVYACFAHLDDLRAYIAEVVRYIHRAGE